jgi:hypothetical protein
MVTSVPSPSLPYLVAIVVGFRTLGVSDAERAAGRPISARCFMISVEYLP